MKKLVLSFVMIISFVTFSSAQKEIKYKKTFYKNQTIENAYVKITIDDAVATQIGMKFKISIVNKTNDYIIFKPSECEFQIKDNKVKPIEKWLVIRPNDKDWKIIDIKGPKYILPENFEFLLEGFYKVSIDAKGNTTPDFKLPPNSNEFNTGGFSVSIDGFKKETARTDAKFKVSYNGDKIGVFEPNKVAAKMPDGKEYANFHSDNKPLLFDKGTEDDFKVAWKDIPIESGDMQKVEMTILWRDAFKEVTPVKMPSLNLTILFDQEMSLAKGR
ncbi:MAG: hypothetical protein NTX97_08670 [Bacteroidetes bacterium]|nr:hypothetical protein [Bacteroidota bacterium]